MTYVGVEAGTPFTKTDGTVSLRRIPKFGIRFNVFKKDLFFINKRFIIKNDQVKRKMEVER